YWSYGLAGNERALSTLIGYSHAQGLARRAFAPRELSAPEKREDKIICPRQGQVSGTAAGNPLSSADPEPICPVALLPQHRMPRPADDAHLCALPAETMLRK